MNRSYHSNLGDKRMKQVRRSVNEHIDIEWEIFERSENTDDDSVRLGVGTITIGGQKSYSFSFEKPDNKPFCIAFEKDEADMLMNGYPNKWQEIMSLVNELVFEAYMNHPLSARKAMGLDFPDLDKVQLHFEN